MTELLVKAFQQAAQLPSEEQDAFARFLLEELASEEKWNKLFAKSEDELTKVAQDIRAQIRKGKIEPLDPTRL